MGLPQTNEEGYLWIEGRICMKKLTYFAVFEPVSNDGYSVFFSDVPGCFSVGKDFNEALKKAKEALELHYWLFRYGEALISQKYVPVFHKICTTISHIFVPVFGYMMA